MTAIFNSLGSNYSAKEAWLNINSLFSDNPDENLRQKINELIGKYYQGEVNYFLKGRDAIEFALKSVAVGSSDFVITQAFACYAIEEAIIRSGATAVYSDIAPNKVYPTIVELEQAFNKQPKSKAVIITHTLGQHAPIDDIAKWCAEKQIILIEDFAQDFGTKPHTYTAASILSFGRDKVIDSVIGGACVLHHPARQRVTVESETDLKTESYLKKSIIYPALTLIIRETYSFGIGKLIHQICKKINLLDHPLYSPQSKITALPNKILPHLLSQLENLDEIANHRRRIANVYLNNILQSPLIQLISEKINIDHSSNLRFSISSSKALELISHLATKNIFISDRWYRKAVDSGNFNCSSSYQSGSCANAEDLANKIINLPTHRYINLKKALYICEQINKWQVQILTQKKSTIKILEELDNETWETQIKNYKEANFLQSGLWAEFQKKLKKETHQLNFFDDQDNLIAKALIIIEKAKRGTYATIAAGPLLNWDDENLIINLAGILDALKIIGKKYHCNFIRFRPQAISKPALLNLLKIFGCIQSPMHVTADLTLQLDLLQPSEQILKNMRKNTRHEINRATQLGITVKESTNADDINDFYDQQLALAKRQGFVPFAKHFLQKQFSTFANKDSAKLFHAYLNNELLASAFVIFYNQEAVYHYGVSTPANAKLPGSYACQWAAILEAQKRGCRTYNFWGVAPKENKTHRFAGVGIFKRGFGGQEVEYICAQDLPVNYLYWFTNLFETFRKKLRRL